MPDVHKKKFNFWAFVRRPIVVLKIVVPMFLGTWLLVWLLQSAYSEDGSDLSKTALVLQGPFKGSTFSLCVFIASLAVTMIGTFIYVWDLSGYRKLLNDKPGERQITAAFALTMLTIVVATGAIIFSVIFPSHPHDLESICTYTGVYAEFTGHIMLAVGIFIAFIVVDVLTLWGMNSALKEQATPDPRLVGYRKFASNQILLVDIPVLVGALLSLVLIYAPDLLQLEFMVMDAGDDGMFKIAEDSVTCGKGENTLILDVSDIGAMISNLYLSGIATGYLAAHVLMSQLVFVILSLISEVEENHNGASGRVQGK